LKWTDIISGLVQIGSDDDTDPAKLREGVQPVDVLAKMREQKCPDIEITFTGMAFIIQGALEVIKEAIVCIKSLQKPNIFWVLTPLLHLPY
jgi:hypothetical protein